MFDNHVITREDGQPEALEQQCGACRAEAWRDPEDGPNTGFSRRVFLKSGALALIGVALSPSFLTRAVMADPATRRGRTLVVVFQRGAADGLNMVVPFREPAYYKLRRSTAIPPPGSAGQTAIDLDGSFGLHPALAPFKLLWDRRMLAIVHASGSPDNTRSHFDAQDFMESAAPGNKSVHDGWLNRFLAADRRPGDNTFRAVALTPNLPRSLQGPAPALAIPNLREFGIQGGRPMERSFAAMYASGAHGLLQKTGRESFTAVDELRGRMRQLNASDDRIRYPSGPFGNQMRQVAALIKAGVGLEIACTEIGGWDNHANEGGARGQMAQRLAELSGTLAVFAADLGDRMQDVVILTMSEFGRKLEENGSGGTDHGHANCNFIVGGGVRGGRVYTTWPGLEHEQLFEGRDLALTTDFRDVFGEIVVRHLGCRNTGPIFPGYDVEAGRFRNFLA